MILQSGPANVVQDEFQTFASLYFSFSDLLHFSITISRSVHLPVNGAISVFLMAD